MADESVSVRSVKLKVHYTFDVEHKNDHLTKPPQSFEVQTAAVDDNTTIGIIDLRTCLEAVVNSSPELTSSEDNDFTVYAYDYSEPNVPLVGQGRLSKIFFQDVGNESDSETMVTGRITKNLLGMFSKNAQPFLEVKLRFTPVAASGQRGRSGSISSATDGVQPQWVGMGYSQGPQSPADTSSLEAMQRMLSEGGPVRDRRGSYQVDSFYQGGTSRPSSRPGTPNNQAAPSLHQMNLQPRPSSQAGFRQPSYGRRDSFNSGYYSAEEYIDEGPARKRARTTKVKAPTKSDFNIEQQPNSLRVVASAASSVRLHRPVPLNPTAALQQGLSAEEPIRPPTPIPKGNAGTGRPKGRPKKRTYPNLEKGRGRASSPAVEARSQSQMPDVSMSSPEDTRDNGPQESTNSSPVNLPSSPPVMPEQQSFVTSPMLPTLHHHDNDSGFMSGTLDELFGHGDDIDFSEFLNDKGDDSGARQFDNQQNSTIDARYPPVFEEDSAVEGPTPQPNQQSAPTPMLLPAPQRPASRTSSQGASKQVQASNSSKSVRSAPPLLPRPQPMPELQRSHSALPQVPASDPVGRTFQRSNTWAPDMSDAIMSDAVGSSDPNKPRSRKRVGKEQTQARLENAIAAGQMPPFCDNCGAIETPAWRRGFIKIFDCPWEEVETSLLPGACCYKEPMEYHADGSIKLFKGYKVEKLPTDKFEDWKQINLCNPCGLWFHKSKCPRPPEKWQKKDPKEKRKRKRPPKGPKSRTNPPRVAAGNLQSDAQTPGSDESSPTDTAAEVADAEDNADNMTMNEDDTGDDGEPQLPPMPARPTSAGPTIRSYNALITTPSLPRLVQSSPLAQRKDPDLTPKPLRRVLFPSPTEKLGAIEMKGVLVEKKNEALLPSFVRRSPRLNKVRNVFAETEATVILSVDGEGKENMTPHVTFDDGLETLFGNDEDGLMLPPLTPTPKRRSERILSKTSKSGSGREFGIELSPNQQFSPSMMMKTPKIAHPLASIMLESAQRNLDPKMMTPFTRSIHEALAEETLNPQTPQTRSKSGRTPKKVVGSGSKAFDFPDLPSLKNSSPMSTGQAAFNFSELTTDRLQTDFEDIFSTEAPMPSSPPTGFYEFLNSNSDKSSLWDHIDFSGAGEDSQQFQTPKKQKSNEENSLNVPTPNGLRRSPRKHETRT